MPDIDKVWSVKGQTFRMKRDDEVTAGLGLPRDTRLGPGFTKKMDERGNVRVSKSYVLDRTRKGGKRIRMKPGTRDMKDYETPAENKSAVRSETERLVEEFKAKGGKVSLCPDGNAKGV